MTVQAILEQLERNGLKVKVSGDKLLVAPREALTPEIRDLLRQRKPEILALLQDPRTRLWSLLTTWARMDESMWTHAAVDQLKNEIMDVFSAYPRDADTWFREWRQAHPEAKLA